MTKVVVCYGDSNTWGADPAGTGRFAPDVRWTGVLQAELGSGYKIIEEGLNGRTTNIEDTIEEDRNGRRQLPPTIESHRPFDLMIIMLGTNDLAAAKKDAPEGLWARLEAGEVPAWLEPVPMPKGSPLRLYRIKG